MKERLSKLNEKYCVLGWLFLLLMPVLKIYLPASWGDENGVMENLQMVWLFLGVVWCWREARSKDLPDWGGNTSAFWYSGLIFYILLIGREVSWGRAFFMDVNGHMIQWEEMGIYGVLAHPIIGVLIVLLLFFLWRSKFWIFAVKMWKKFPYPELCLFFIYVFAQHVAEHMHCPLWDGELAEELAETGAYIVMEWLTRHIATDFKRGEWA
ncbi:MAG: hypothetical protein KBS60_01565 [Phascolarctobacterium sp.]|nr:hypothetical protein [Candidatus Phascolarctobacterium caballi]